MTVQSVSAYQEETKEQRDSRLYKQARREGITVQWSTDGDALVTSESKRPLRHRVRFDQDLGSALFCPCEARTRCKHQICAEVSWQRIMKTRQRRGAKASDMTGQLRRSLRRGNGRAA